MNKAEDVTEYIASSLKVGRPKMKELHKIKNSNVPEAVERIVRDVINYKL